MRSEPLPSLTATEVLAERLAALVTPGDVIALRGGLGAGKTTLARALIIRLMGHPTEVPSPTYNLVQTYEGPVFPIWHFDLYRLTDPDEVIELGWEDTIDGLVVVEWPDRAGLHLPVNRLDLTLQHSTESRVAHLAGHGEEWQRRLNEWPSSKI